MTPTHPPEKLEDLDLTYRFYLPQTAPGSLKVGDVLVRADDAELVEKAQSTAPEDATVYRLTPITFKYLRLGGKQIRHLQELEERMLEAQKPMLAVLSGAPKPDLIETSVRIFQAAGGAVDPDTITQIHTSAVNEAMTSYLQVQATTTDTDVTGLSRQEADIVRACGEERAAILWGISYETVKIVADFPGAYIPNSSYGFMAEWLTHTDELIQQIINFQKAAGN